MMILKNGEAIIIAIMNVFQELSDNQRVYSRTRSKTKPKHKLNDLTNQTPAPKQKATRKKPTRKPRKKKTVAAPLSKELKQLKQQYEDLSNEKLTTISSRAKQNRITKKAITLSIDKISKDSNRTLNEELNLTENEVVDANIAAGLGEFNDTFESSPCDTEGFLVEPELGIHFDTLDLQGAENEDSESDSSDLLIELSSASEDGNPNADDSESLELDNLELEFDGFSINETESFTTNMVPADNTVVRLAQIINDQQDLTKIEENTGKIMLPESVRLASLVAQEIDQKIDDIGDGEQTVTLNSVLQAMAQVSAVPSTKHATNSFDFESNSFDFESNSFDELEELELEDTDNITLHGEFTTTLQTVMDTLKL
ncbi:MAG: hypothetical protein NXI00_23005 [Cytophagales bacterium]|nr:hypothetical protein [Cytophagales bacterium]